MQTVTDKIRILSLDDNQQNLNLIQQTLEQSFDVLSSTGEESIDALVLDHQPDIILLDILLGDISGYDVCRCIRQLPLDKYPLIIFISALNSLDDKLKAYEVGGDDYICKPIDLTELEYKIDVCEKHINRHQNLTAQAEEASRAAFASMQQSSELGVLIEFFTHSLSVHNFDELYLASNKTLANFHLSAAIEFRSQNKTTQYPRTQISRLESEILALGKQAKRIVPFGRNMLLNSPQCSLLIKKLPEDEEITGRLRDHLAILLEIINSRVLFIQTEENRQQLCQKTVTAVKTAIESNFNHINTNLEALEHKLDQTFTELETTLRRELIHMGASQPQEQEICCILEHTKEQFESIVETSINIDYHIRDINHSLNNIH